MMQIIKNFHCPDKVGARIGTVVNRGEVQGLIFMSNQWINPLVNDIHAGSKSDRWIKSNGNRMGIQ